MRCETARQKAEALETRRAAGRRAEELAAIEGHLQAERKAKAEVGGRLQALRETSASKWERLQAADRCALCAVRRRSPPPPPPLR